ncbi:MAG: hypothetical protein KGR16_00600 [Verrucomicrobia bacterium]|nr:hypothetical protein [Verrucomicrobiota bacterium]MDE3047474.1 hypothetical protein [Verrucomicrobiota bacterium]
MNTKQIIGLVCGIVILGIGAYLMKSGYSSTDHTKEKIKHKITGSYSHGVRKHMRVGTSLIVIGAVVAAGTFYFLRSGRKAH